MVTTCKSLTTQLTPYLDTAVDRIWYKQPSVMESKCVNLVHSPESGTREGLLGEAEVEDGLKDTNNDEVL